MLFALQMARKANAERQINALRFQRKGFPYRKTQKDTLETL
jgi:hypothetical protein